MRAPTRCSPSLNTYTLGANLENLTFTGSGDFTGTGNALGNVITGGTGNDALNGLDGNDTLNGGIGNDTLDGGIGADTMVGGAGNDIYVVENVGDIVTEGAGGGIDLVRTTLGTYTLAGNVENLTFIGSGGFTGTGNALDNVITGGSGTDVLSGAGGNDTLIGGIGVDSLDGGAGDDRLIGGTGNDLMNGGTGNDTFVFATGFGNDTISGFDANPTGGQDLLDISGLGITAATFAALCTSLIWATTCRSPSAATPSRCSASTAPEPTSSRSRTLFCRSDSLENKRSRTAWRIRTCTSQRRLRGSGRGKRRGRATIARRSSRRARWGR